MKKYCEKDPPGRFRQNQVKVYFSDDELKILNKKFEISGLKTRSDFLRQLILNGLVCYVDFTELKKSNLTLSGIGRNINQIAKKCNETGNVYREDIEKIKERLEDIWQLQRSMQSRLLSEGL